MIWPVLGEGKQYLMAFHLIYKVFLTSLTGNVLDVYTTGIMSVSLSFLLGCISLQIPGYFCSCQLSLRDGMLSVWIVDVSLAAWYILGMPDCRTVLGPNHQHNMPLPKT